jgi:hypothetical protein
LHRILAGVPVSYLRVPETGQKYRKAPKGTSNAGQKGQLGQEQSENTAKEEMRLISYRAAICCQTASRAVLSSFGSKSI